MNEQVPQNQNLNQGVQYPDPAYRFSVVYKDGRIIDQEDENGHVVIDHTHIENWDDVEIYALRNRPGDHVVSVNFENGDFAINSNVIKMLTHELDMLRGELLKDIVFKPIYGRRVFSGDVRSAKFYYCGWEAVIGNRKIRRVIYVSEHGDTFLEAKGM